MTMNVLEINLLNDNKYGCPLCHSDTLILSDQSILKRKKNINQL